MRVIFRVVAGVLGLFLIYAGVSDIIGTQELSDPPTLSSFLFGAMFLRYSLKGYVLYQGDSSGWDVIPWKKKK